MLAGEAGTVVVALHTVQPAGVPEQGVPPPVVVQTSPVVAAPLHVQLVPHAVWASIAGGATNEAIIGKATKEPAAIFRTTSRRDMPSNLFSTTESGVNKLSFFN